jgi:hypothetical protein
MKTKTTTRQRTAEREFDVAVMDCKSEYGEVYTDDIIDIDVLVLDDEEED